MSLESIFIDFFGKTDINTPNPVRLFASKWIEETNEAILLDQFGTAYYLDFEKFSEMFPEEKYLLGGNYDFEGAIRLRSFKSFTITRVDSMKQVHTERMDSVENSMQKEEEQICNSSTDLAP